MLIPEPINSIASSILTNIASDIVENHMTDLENTFAGRLLKWSGLVQPDFNDRLRETLKKTLQLFFQTYPQYNLSGIEDFFRDPTVARQIGDYILDRQPIDEQQIEQALAHHLLNDPTTVFLMRQRKVVPQRIIPDFLECYRRVLNMHLSVAETSLLLEVLDQSDHVIGEIRASETRMKTFLDELLRTKLSPQALQAASQTNREQGTIDLIQEMEQAKLVQPNEALQTIQKRLQSLPTLFIDGLCKGRVMRPTPHEYFVSHSFPADTLVDWRKTLANALAKASKTSEQLTPYFHGDTLVGGYRLCGICEKLYATRFSIFLLPPSQDRNVYLELGIALGLGMPFLLIQPHGTDIPLVLTGLNRYVTNGSLRTLRQELPSKIGKIEEYDFGVVHVNKNLPPAGQQSTYVIAAGNLIDDLDMEYAISTPMQKTYPRLEALSLRQQAEESGSTWMLEQLIDIIQQARFAIYRINESSSPTTFLAVGISIALNRPFLMIKDARSEVPVDLRGIGLYEFPNFTSLEREFVTRHQAFLNRYV
jgi:hypothetical protein